MKIEFELTIDEITGEPKIKFRHHDRSDELEQKLLNVFILKAKTSGIELFNTNGHLEAGTKNSWENYEIKISKDK
jgi:hypothetical protein